MIDDIIKLVYRYVFTKDPQYLVALLITSDGMAFANEYFINSLRQECIDCIFSNPVLKKHFQRNIDYVVTYLNKKPVKGLFKRV